MSNFYTSECTAENSYEITFCTDDRDVFEKVRDLCREFVWGKEVMAEKRGEKKEQDE